MESYGWDNNMVVPYDDVPPSASDIENRMENIYIGHINNRPVQYTNGDIVGLLFPWLFPNGQGYPGISRSEGHSLKEHVKMLLAHPHDRRFGKSCAFIFFALDMLEKMQSTATVSVSFIHVH